MSWRPSAPRGLREGPQIGQLCERTLFPALRALSPLTPTLSRQGEGWSHPPLVRNLLGGRDLLDGCVELDDLRRLDRLPRSLVGKSEGLRSDVDRFVAEEELAT